MVGLEKAYTTKLQPGRSLNYCRYFRSKVLHAKVVVRSMLFIYLSTILGLKGEIYFSSPEEAEIFIFFSARATLSIISAIFKSSSHQRLLSDYGLQDTNLVQ